MKKKISERKWYLVNAEDKKLGRLASKITILLRGKNKTDFVPYKDMGDFVIVINLAKIDLSPKKLLTKKYYSHSGYPGHLKEKSAKDIFSKEPNKILKKAVAGMLPANKLRKDWLSRLKIYSGSEHKHKAQKIIELEI